ncbi:uncharacterized protein LOC118756662, partial [Rhagoletis pomonella]|uniref:uncharacterized protein LOC118756662 n=1 Tax=Rhagoletis pomonella TaxID=28610 RepID=UPI00178058D9
MGEEDEVTHASAGNDHSKVEAKLVLLRTQRNVFERHITNLHDKVNSDGDKEDARVLECRLQILDSHYRQLCQIQTQIENLQSTDTARASQEELFIAAKVKIMALLQAKRRPSAPSMAESSFINTTMTAGAAHHNRLPKLKLPSFDGKYATFKRFKSTFANLIHNDPYIATIDKFNYLLNCLSGPALEVVQSFQITEDNYSKALERLDARYDNDVLIFLDCISSLFALPTMTQPEATTLQKLVDNASAIRGSLLSIGSAEEIMNNIMIHILLSKVDAQTKAKYNEQQGFDKLSSWEDCCNTLNRRCQYLESQGDHQSDQRGAKPKVKQASTSKTFVPTNANCVYCNSPSHYISSCNKFKELSLQQRIDYVRKAGICFNCLRKTHCMKECQSKSRCKICQSVHHTLLHNFTQGANLRMPVSTAPSKVQDSNNAMPQSSALLVSRTIKKGIIPTAIVPIRDKFGQLHLVRALLDSCSEISFITEETAKLLQLEKRRVQQEVSGIAGIRQKISHNVFATAPHFGGLWEAAVKSTKTIVLKNIANAHLTFEELQTVFIEVEAILNSRPIAPMTDDPNDAEAVTPAHFLIGSTLTPAPEETLYSNSDNSEKKMSYLNRWLKVAYLKQQFWSLWERDYVHSLQQRAKWTQSQPN